MGDCFPPDSRIADVSWPGDVQVPTEKEEVRAKLLAIGSMDEGAAAPPLATICFQKSARTDLPLRP